MSTFHFAISALRELRCPILTGNTSLKQNIRIMMAATSEAGTLGGCKTPSAQDTVATCTFVLWQL